MTLVSIPLMDRTGRRTLHLYGLGGMFIFSIFITISFLIKASIGVSRILEYCSGSCKVAMPANVNAKVPASLGLHLLIPRPFSDLHLTLNF